ncbi:MAG: hypothetical protein GY793_11610, partial [Proteobacteria bacterium]|nr:hypothetical protein [Pseudomonadota bacterium]
MKTFYEFFRKGLFVTFAVNFIFLNSCSATNIKIYMPKLDSKTAKKIIIKGTAVVNYPKKGGSIIDDYYYGKFENLEVLKAYEISELKYCEIKCFVRKFENSDSWEAVVSPDKPQCTKEKLYFRIYGLKSKPEQVEFYKEISLNEIQSDDTYYNLQEDNFIINDRKADRIEFDTLTTESNTTEGEYWHYPRVKLYFDNEKAESENGKTELPEDTINEVNSNQFNLFGNKTELNFFNNKGKIIASRVWEGPFNSLHIPEEMKNYKKIELRTSLFTCFCTKPSLKKIGIHDFFKTVTVEVNAPFLQFSYISDKDEIPFYVYKELTESEIHLQLPVTIPEEKIKWILLAIGQNNQYIEKELSIDDSKI